VKIRLGCAPDVPLQRLQAFLGLLETHEHVDPDFEAEVRHLPSARQLQWLHEGRLDLGLVHDTGQCRGIEAEPLFRGEALAAVVSLAHPVAAHETVGLEDLAGDVLLVVPHDAEPGLHSAVAALAVGDGSRFRAIREAPGPSLRDLLFAVASGRGSTLLSASSLRVAGDLGDAVTARPLEPPQWMPATMLAWPRDPRPELRAVYAASREVARQLYPY
jgi:hypothetical protein